VEEKYLFCCSVIRLTVTRSLLLLHFIGSFTGELGLASSTLGFFLQLLLKITFANKWHRFVTVVSKIRTHCECSVELEVRSVERIPSPPTLTFDLDLPKFNHLVPCDQGNG